MVKKVACVNTKCDDIKKVYTSRRNTARSRLVAVLAEEILNSSEQGAFQIASEHELCRQHNLSRVTVRLALSDLENKGLIYRRHGKGTFAHPRTTVRRKAVAVLNKSASRADHWPLAEMSRGVQNVLAPLRVPMIVVSTPPNEWPVEMITDLAGVIVFPHDVTATDLVELNNRKVPHIIVGESSLHGPQVRLGQAAAAQDMTERLLGLGHRQFALLTGYDAEFDAAKREGVHQALRAAQIDPASVPEYSASATEGGAEEAVRALLAAHPRPTAVMAFDDSYAALLSLRARRDKGLTVPDDLSIAGFHDSPYLRYLEPILTTVHFDFVGAGRLAAETLNRVVLTGESIGDLSLPPVFCPGQTIGPVRA